MRKKLDESNITQSDLEKYIGFHVSQLCRNESKFGLWKFIEMPVHLNHINLAHGNKSLIYTIRVICVLSLVQKNFVYRTGHAFYKWHMASIKKY